jgi:hypothetical protein
MKSGGRGFFSPNSTSLGIPILALRAGHRPLVVFLFMASTSTCTVYFSLDHCVIADIWYSLRQ